jgi:hypothetical protein
MSTHLPAVLPEIDPSLPVEQNPFVLEEGLLQPTIPGGGPEADLTFGIDHSLPRDTACGLEGVEGVTDLACLPRQSGHQGDLAIGGDLAPGDSPNDLVDLLVGRRLNRLRLR